jgi:hypothetical protein
MKYGCRKALGIAGNRCLGRTVGLPLVVAAPYRYAILDRDSIFNGDVIGFLANGID